MEIIRGGIMVNKKRLLELLGENFNEDCGGIRYNTYDVVWIEDDLEKINSIPQLLGYMNCGMELKIYDEIYSKVDDSIFEVDMEKVKANLSKLGLIFEREDCDGDVVLNCDLMIDKENLKYVEKMEIIPHALYKGCIIYNDVLKASKEWGK